MTVYFVILSVIYIALCLVMVTCILLQKKRTSGLGSLSGTTNAPTYWDKNKGKSMEGALEKYTKICGVLFFVLAFALSFIK